MSTTVESERGAQIEPERLGLRRYVAPRLVRFGDLAEFTKNNIGGPGTDGGSFPTETS